MKPFADSIWQNRDDAKSLIGCVEKSESTGTSLDDRFIKTLVDLVMEILDVHYRDREVTTRCLKSAIEKDVRGYLEAYLNGSLEILARTINRTLKIDEKVDYKYVVHSKFNSIVKKIQSLLRTANDSG